MSTLSYRLAERQSSTVETWLATALLYGNSTSEGAILAALAMEYSSSFVLLRFTP